MESLERYESQREAILRRNCRVGKTWFQELSWRCFVASDLLTRIAVSPNEDPEDILYEERLKYQMWARTSNNEWNKRLFRAALEELSNIEENIFTIE